MIFRLECSYDRPDYLFEVGEELPLLLRLSAFCIFKSYFEDMAKDRFDRDELGNIKTPDIEFNREEYRYWQFTYIFCYHDQVLNRYLPCFNIEEYDQQSLDVARLQPDFVEVDVHAMPLEMVFRNELIYNRNFQSLLLFDHFKAVFEVGQDFHQANKYYRVIMKKTHYHQIMVFLNNHDLLLIRDFFMEMIARAQNEYLEHSYLLNRRTLEKKIRNLRKDVEKLESVIDKAEERAPLSIQFNFSDGIYKLTDDMLTVCMLKDFRDFLSQLPLKDWRASLNRYGNFYNDDEHHLNFRERYCKALYEFMVKGNFVPLDEAKTPNQLLYLIDEVVGFSGIPIGSRDEVSAVRIKHLRNYLKRNDLQEPLKSLDLPADKKLLERYFTKDFVAMAVGDTRREEVLEIVGWLSYRFHLQDRINELAHIVQCLRDFVYILWDQLSSGIIGNYRFESFDHYATFIKAIKAGGKITLAEFNVDGQSALFSFKDRMPLYVIENALQNYVREHKEEVENDLIGGGVLRVEPQSLKLNFLPEFQQPEARFVIGFVRSMYDFLLQEFPPGERDYFPAERYYRIIAVTLQRIGYFRSQPPISEDSAVEQVQRWHILGRNTSTTK